MSSGATQTARSHPNHNRSSGKQRQEQPKTERTHQRGNGKEREEVEGKHTDGVKAEDKVNGTRIVEKKSAKR